MVANRVPWLVPLNALAAVGLVLTREFVSSAVGAKQGCVAALTCFAGRAWRELWRKGIARHAARSAGDVARAVILSGAFLCRKLA
eukprot:1921213-Lingulodinium_polyedra.AAC.1